jgi:putative ABC transport system permease protein
MLRVALNNVWSYKRRMVGTVLAVVLGVAFLAGTLLLGDTLSRNFDRLFIQANGTTDVLLRSTTKVGTYGGQDIRAGIDAALVNKIAAVPGVQQAVPYVEGAGQLLGSDGKAIGGNGPPTRAANWVAVPSLNPYRLASGRAPQADDEVVINRGAATTGHLRVGDRTTLLTPRPVSVRVVGISTFGTADGFGPTTFTGMTLAAAQRYLTTDAHRIGSVLVAASPGVPQAELVDRIRPVVGAGIEAVTGTQLANENVSSINSGFLGFVRTALTAFAIIALLVAAFSIYNTFAIIAAQRSRESALLRALGASRRQVVAASLIETVVIGMVGSVIGLLGGIGIASGLKAVFDGFGFALPAGGLDFRASSSLIAIGAGLLATVVAGALPTVRSSRIAPIAALRDAAAESAHISTRRLVAGVSLTLIGITGTVVGALGGTAGLVAPAAVVTVVGVVLVGPAVARPVASVLGAPIARLRGVTGQLARQNATRNPRRTSASSLALLIGVAVVALFTVVGASLKDSASQGIDRSLRADLVLSNGSYGGTPGGAGLSPELASALKAVPGVATVTALGSGDVLVDGRSQTVSTAGLDQLGQVVNLQVSAGELPAASLAVSKAAADSHQWQVGSSVTVTYPDASTSHLRVGAIYRYPDLIGDYLMSEGAWRPHARQLSDTQVMLRLAPGAQAVAVKAAAIAASAPYGSPRVQDRAEFKASTTSGVNTILGLVYVMLVLAIVIALMGISNTLSLAIHERRRELGLLRAVGQSRAQSRSMMRWESVVTALLGTVLGVLLGAFLGWAVVTGAGSAALAVFTLPAAQLAVFLVVGAFAGVLAGLRPARRAARLDILNAIAAE